MVKAIVCALSPPAVSTLNLNSDLPRILFCLASFCASFRVVTVPSLIINYSQLCMRRLFESLKGLKEHPASSHNSLSYANARAQHRPLRVWAWAGRLRSPLLCFNDYCGGFLSVYLQMPYQCFWNPHRRGKDEGVLNWRWLCARWIVKTGIK